MNDYNYNPDLILSQFSHNKNRKILKIPKSLVNNLIF